MIHRQILVIGGGAAGLMAGLAASDLGAKVTILEKNQRVGRKILATGNGRCNFTNSQLHLKHFHGKRPEFALGPLRHLDGPQTIELFRRLGIEPLHEEAGRIFPASGQASSILDALRYRLEENGADVICDTTVKSIIKQGSLFSVGTTSGTFQARAVIVATGGKAGPQFGCNGDGYALAASFGHRLVEPFPALVQLRLDAPFLKAIAGVKFTGEAAITSNGNLIQRAAGDILFTDYGISGLPILALSRTAGELLLSGRRPCLRIALRAGESAERAAHYLRHRFTEQGTKTTEFSLVGLINKRLIRPLLARAGIDPGMLAAHMDEQQTAALASLLTGWTFSIIGANGWTAAQVTAGGLDVGDIDSRTLGSKLVDGLYFAGEIIDIDGDSGGYNLQWAWSSGYTAARAAVGVLAEEPAAWG